MLRRIPLGWLFRIRTRLLLINLLIVAVPWLGIAFARFYEREMLRSLERDMIDQAEVIRRLIAQDPSGLPLTTLGPVLAGAARETRTRIRILGPDGRQLADSHANGPPEGPEEEVPSFSPTSRDWKDDRRAGHAKAEMIDPSRRPEVADALAGRYGATTRFWSNRGTLYLFSALPIVVADKVEGVVYVTRSTNPVRAAMYRLRTNLFSVLFGALGATVVLSLFLAKTISEPLSRLTRIAQRIAAGDRSCRLVLERRDEVGQLARAFDMMAARLDERTRVMARLAADISHEFKSPLAGIRGAAELLTEGAADDPRARSRFLENILADAHRLDRLVTRLLELSRVEADIVAHERLDYEALVRETAARSRGKNPVEVRYLARRTQVDGRRAQLSSALSNLLDNAQQHANPGTPIELYVGEGRGGALSTSVHNWGPVIHESNLPRIWDRFFTTRSEAGGTGLGLPIVRAAIEAHGGTVFVTSTQAEGTTFTFDLPGPVG